ncbi:hypothetical protein DL89DRAFT_114726 [Linderina pennispora]|uniref:Mid2 domain-containing protein n=1 Tax=Linderina pennispora TaxID=61395 RepID=A0A1Y1VW36_9FUNG|nr:uncharacterized protein DL89DRAFT_114726 [Linderina pennispora]ORX65423.1 hypothetical protein DL89DRAFT_114726 [Linderina pennispora]
MKTKHSNKGEKKPAFVMLGKNTTCHLEGQVSTAPPRPPTKKVGPARCHVFIHSSSPFAVCAAVHPGIYFLLPLPLLSPALPRLFLHFPCYTYILMKASYLAFLLSLCALVIAQELPSTDQQPSASDTGVADTTKATHTTQSTESTGTTKSEPTSMTRSEPTSDTTEHITSTPTDMDTGDTETVTSTTTVTSFPPMPTTKHSSAKHSTAVDTSHSPTSTEPTPVSTDTSTGTPSPTKKPTLQDSKKKSNLPTGAIIGIVIGGVVVLAGAFIAFLFWRRSKQRSKFSSKIDYAEFPEFSPSHSNANQTSALPHNQTTNTGLGLSDESGHPQQGVFLRELDEA